MIDFISAYSSLAELVLVNACLAYSQFIVLRAGVFSLATAGLASLGAYTAGLLVIKLGIPGELALLAAGAVGLLAGGLLSIPLAQLRGVFQAIATLAFVQIVLSLALYAESLTGGAMGLNNIPHWAGPGRIAVVTGLVVFLGYALSSSGIGLAFDTIRQDETVALSLGMSVAHYQRVAFLLAGFIAGLAGGLMALRNYSLVPEDFGFPLLVSVLTFVVLGGRNSLAGPLVGALVLTLLPEIARPLADYRKFVHGFLMILVIVYWPQGILDTLLLNLRQRRARRLENSANNQSAAVAP